MEDTYHLTDAFETEMETSDSNSGKHKCFLITIF